MSRLLSLYMYTNAMIPSESRTHYVAVLEPIYVVNLELAEQLVWNLPNGSY